MFKVSEGNIRLQLQRFLQFVPVIHSYVLVISLSPVYSSSNLEYITNNNCLFIIPHKKIQDFGPDVVGLSTSHLSVSASGGDTGALQTFPQQQNKYQTWLIKGANVCKNRMCACMQCYFVAVKQSDIDQYCTIFDVTSSSTGGSNYLKRQRCLSLPQNKQNRTPLRPPYRVHWSP